MNTHNFLIELYTCTYYCMCTIEGAHVQIISVNMIYYVRNTYVWHWRAYCWALLPLTDNMATYVHISTNSRVMKCGVAYVHTYVRTYILYWSLLLLKFWSAGIVGKNVQSGFSCVLTLAGGRPTHTYDSWECSYQCAPGICSDNTNGRDEDALAFNVLLIKALDWHYGPLQTTYNYVIHWLMSHQVWCGAPWCLQVFAPPDQAWSACHKGEECTQGCFLVFVYWLCPDVWHEPTHTYNNRKVHNYIIYI